MNQRRSNAEVTPYLVNLDISLKPKQWVPGRTVLAVQNGVVCVAYLLASCELAERRITLCTEDRAQRRKRFPNLQPLVGEITHVLYDDENSCTQTSDGEE